MSLSAQIVNLLAALLLLIGFAMLAQRRILTLIHLFAWQGVVLAASTLIVAHGTPGFIIGTELVPGALELKDLKSLIRQVRQEKNS